MQTRSDFLFARPSFIEGMARLFDFGGTLNEYNTVLMTDETALALDWASVGADLWDALDVVVVEHGLPRLYETRAEAGVK